MQERKDGVLVFDTARWAERDSDLSDNEYLDGDDSMDDDEDDDDDSEADEAEGVANTKALGKQGKGTFKESRRLGSK